MKNWDSLETELKKWTPRQPSPELRARIFRAPAQMASIRTGRRAADRGFFADLTYWLVPALGCFLLAAGTLSHRYPVHGPIALSAGATNLLLPDGHGAYSEAAIASRLSGANHSDVNALPAPRLEWSFGSSASSTPPTAAAVSYTNKIIQ